MSQTAAERRAAQRKLAKDLQAGTPLFTPAQKGRTTKAGRLIHTARLKEKLFGDRPGFNADSSYKAVKATHDGEAYSAKQVKGLDLYLQAKLDGDEPDWDEYVDEYDLDRDALHYK
jgi:hypothetical protein